MGLAILGLPIGSLMDVFVCVCLSSVWMKGIGIVWSQRPSNWFGNNVDGQIPAPPKKPWNDSIPLQIPTNSDFSWIQVVQNSVPTVWWFAFGYEHTG